MQWVCVFQIGLIFPPGSTVPSPKNDNITSSSSINDETIQSLKVANAQMDLGCIDTNAEFTGDATSTWQHVTGEAIEREVLQNDLNAIYYFEVLFALTSQVPQE